jgi:hypothetical protein
MDQKIMTNRCQALTKADKPCGAPAGEGGLCFFHANPSKASELGRIGGRRKRYTAGANADPLPTLDNALAVQQVVARLVAEVYAGTIHPRVAAGLAPLLSLQLRAIETTDMLRLELLERRLEAIEKQSAKAPGDARLADVATAAKR